MKLSEYLTKYNYTSQTPDFTLYDTKKEFKAKKQIDSNAEMISNNNNTDKIDITITKCGHTLNKPIKTVACCALQKRELPCAECRTGNIYEKWEKKHNITIKQDTHMFICNDCERFYNREPNALMNNITTFKCLCKMKKESELQLYDLLSKTWKYTLYKNFSFDDGTNKSADFYVKIDDKTIVFELQDSSHYIKRNRDADIVKKALFKNLPNVHCVYIDSLFLKRDIKELSKFFENILNWEDKFYLFTYQGTKLTHLQCEDTSNHILCKPIKEKKTKSKAKTVISLEEPVKEDPLIKVIIGFTESE